jgi:protein phosphatase 1L
MKEYGVINTPFISKHPIDNKLKWAVIASDGIWDMMREEDVFRLVNSYCNADELGKTIVKEAINKGSRDNISCIVIKFN